MTSYQRAIELLPERLRSGIDKHSTFAAEEIHLRLGRPLTILCSGTEHKTDSPEIAERDIIHVLEKATYASVHSAIPTLRNGFVPYHGLRIGVCGKTIVNNEEICGFSSYSSLNIRIPSAFSGNISDIAEMINAEKFHSALVISPPGIGKTTALRELIRLVSDKGAAVSVVDDRNEIFPVENTADMGANTDILSGTDKLRGAMMLLKSMNPKVIALDEISSPADASAVREISGCGVGILATAHGECIEDMRKREMYRRLFEEKVFEYALEVRIENGTRTYRLRPICQ